MSIRRPTTCSRCLIAATASPRRSSSLGSADDIDSIATSFHGAAVPVITAAEADLALARGAALASARAVNTLEARPARWRMPSRIGALTSVVAAAVVVFVVSLSVALGLGLTPDTDSTVAQRDTAATADQPARVPTAPSVAQAVPQPVPAAPPPSPAAPPPRLLRPLPQHDRGGRGARAGTAARMVEPPAGTAARVRRRACECSSARLCTARACAELRSARAAATAASRPDHRTHPDHQPVPRAEPVRVAALARGGFGSPGEAVHVLAHIKRQLHVDP